MKRASLLLLLATAIFVTRPLHAFDGCVDSPENPTAVLALVGSAGLFFASARTRIKARRK